ITPFLFLPTGGYDKNKALNLGENRWKLALQGGFITGLSDKLLLDVIGDVTVYGKNSEFGASNASMKQDASFQLQTFLRYNLTP
ncbi:transporter, partial [Enterococcus faecium]